MPGELTVFGDDELVEEGLEKPDTVGFGGVGTELGEVVEEVDEVPEGSVFLGYAFDEEDLELDFIEGIDLLVEGEVLCQLAHSPCGQYFEPLFVCSVGGEDLLEHD